MNVQFEPTGQGTGLTVTGVDLHAVPSPEVVELLRRRIAEEGVLVFRNQRDLSEAQQISFIRAFGETQGHPLPGVGGLNPSADANPQVFYLTNAVEGYDAEDAGESERRRNRKNLEGAKDGKNSAGAGELFWHSDLQYMPEPQVYSLLYGIEVPPDGGETEWCNTIRAYDALDDATKQEIEGLHAVHWFTRRLPAVTHPVVRIHPVTGKRALYVSPGLTRLIEGQAEELGKVLLKRLTDHATRSGFCYRHAWAPGDAVLWDNRCTMHRRRAFDPALRRIVRRTQTVGEPVIAA